MKVNIGECVSKAGEGRVILHKRGSVYREEAKENYKAYLEAKNELVKEHAGKFAVIARGRLVCIADSVEEAVKIADKEAPEAKHIILWRVGEDEGIRVRKMAGSWLRRRC